LWDEELQQNPGKIPSMWKITLKLHRRSFVLGTICGLASGLINTVGRPLVLGLIVQNLSNVEEMGNNASDGLTERVVLLAFLLGLLVLEGFLSVASKHILGDDLGAGFVAVACCLVQRKSRKLGHTSTNCSSSLVANDIQRSYENAKLLAICPVAFSAFFGGVGVLIYSIGPSGIVGVIVMISILIANFRASALAKRAEKRSLEAAEVRLTLLQQIIHGMKAVKLMAWEKPNYDLIKVTKIAWQCIFRCLKHFSTRPRLIFFLTRFYLV
jgi:hypothetical protein